MMGQKATRSTAVAAVAACTVAWTWTATDAAAGAPGVSDQQLPSAFPSWSSRAWNVYQRYYRETTSATENANKGRNHWGRLLGLIADDRHQKRNDDISTSSTRGDMCHSPFGIDERDRIAECFGEDSVVMASYDSDVKFAKSILSTLNALGGDDLPLFDKNVSQTSLFEFSVHHHHDEAATAAALENESALSVPEEDAVVVNDNTQLSAKESVSTSPANITSSTNNSDIASVTPLNTSKTSIDSMDDEQILLTMLKCIGSSSDDVHDFVSASFSQPDGLQEDSLGNLCSMCMQEVQGMLRANNDTAASDSLANTYAGGSSNAYFQLYCADTSGGEGGKSNLLLTAGGGHDGQAGPSDTYGSGGGAGIQIQAQPPTGSEFVFDTFSACNGGGCGLGTHMAGEKLDEDSIVTQDSYCDLGAFVTGLTLVKAEVRKCILDPETDLRFTSGGNSNGFLGNTVDYTTQHEYTTSFSFEIGPNVEL